MELDLPLRTWLKSKTLNIAAKLSTGNSRGDRVTSTLPWQPLPEEVFACIARYLTLADLLRMERVPFKISSVFWL
jgi:hypothetical protein